MSFARGVGVGERGLNDGEQSAGVRDSDGSSERDLLDMAAAAEMLAVEREQVQALMDGGLLVPAGGSGDRVVFLRDGRIVDQTVPAPGPESLLTPNS